MILTTYVDGSTGPEKGLHSSRGKKRGTSINICSSTRDYNIKLAGEGNYKTNSIFCDFTGLQGRPGKEGSGKRLGLEKGKDVLEEKNLVARLERRLPELIIHYSVGRKDEWMSY